MSSTTGPLRQRSQPSAAVSQPDAPVESQDGSKLRDRLPSWISWWFAISSAIVCWDASYVLLRPISMKGGALNYIWWPYNYYGSWDHLYGDEGYRRYLAGEEGWNPTQSVLNLFEVALSIWYLAIVKRNTSTAIAVGTVTATCTVYKTVTYFLIDYFMGWKNSSHLQGAAFWYSYVLPSSFWIVVPLLILAALLPRIAAKRV